MKGIIDTMEGDTACKVADIKGENDEEKTAARKAIMEEFAKGNDLMKQTVDLALLSNNMLKGKELHAFIQRSLDLLKK
jgi:molecular chaperone HtpG